MLAERESRVQYSAIYTSVLEWLNTAEMVVEGDHHGVHYEVVSQKLTLHKVCVQLRLEVTYSSNCLPFVSRMLSNLNSF